MSTIDLRALGLVCGLLAVAACESIPAYDESLGWFSRSEYDAEIRAIERRVPPPEGLPPAPPASGDAARLGPAAVGGRGVTAQPALMPKTGEPRAPVATAALPARDRIAPVGGYANAKRVIYGTNRGPFSSASVRTLR
jgi:hypothetical protein